MNTTPKTPIAISMQSFVLAGSFDIVTLGMTQDWLQDNFLAPDYIKDMGHRFHVWQYGGFELHFDDGVLFMIWCNDVSYLDTYHGFSVDKWLFEDPAASNLEYWQQFFKTQHIPHDVQFDHTFALALLRVEMSNICFWFHKQEDSTEFMLNGIGLCDQEHDGAHKIFRQLPPTILRS